MLDYAITKAINEFGRGTIVDSISYVISKYAFFAIIIALILTFVFVKDRKNFKIVLVAIVIALVLHFVITTGLIKGVIAENVYSRDRPFIAYPGDIITIGATDTDSSFPSGHVAALAALLTAFVYYYRKYWPHALVLTALMAFSRIHNGMHYLTDVLAGAVFGICYGLIAVWIAKKFTRKKLARRKK